MMPGILQVMLDMRCELTDTRDHQMLDGGSVGNGAPDWIEKYAAYGESNEIRSTFVRFLDDELQVVRLAPGKPTPLGRCHEHSRAAAARREIGHV